MQLTENIKRARQALGISQEEAARRVGVAMMTWFGWESGKINPPTSRLSEIAKALETKPTELVK